MSDVRTSNVLRFTVVGIAQPKGSTRAFLKKGRPVVTSDNPKNKSWERQVAVMARLAMQEQHFQYLAGPVALEVQFYLPRPQAIRDTRVPHVKKPDLDKLVRSVKDALTKMAFEDDSQVVCLHASKRYAPPGTTPKAIIFLAAGVTQ